MEAEGNNMNDCKNDYEDILHCNRPVSYKRNPMQRSHRAKQFAAFDALKGYEDAVHAQERLYEPYRELSPEKTEEIDWILHMIRCHDRIKVTWFQPLSHNSSDAGNYLIEAGEVQDIEFQDGSLMVNDIRIPFFSITSVEKE
ncbi:MAG: hypothetical protein LUI87_03180 [Lachnospiraceae bacterium]|nr:hypothetical protein [Lachnospiraceae bacterium]